MFVFVFTLQTRTYVVYSLLIHNSQLMPHAIFYLTTSARRTTHWTHRLIYALHDILLLRKQASKQAAAEEAGGGSWTSKWTAKCSNCINRRSHAQSPMPLSMPPTPPPPPPPPTNHTIDSCRMRKGCRDAVCTEEHLNCAQHVHKLNFLYFSCLVLCFVFLMFFTCLPACPKFFFVFCFVCVVFTFLNEYAAVVPYRGMATSSLFFLPHTVARQ